MTGKHWTLDTGTDWRMLIRLSLENSAGDIYLFTWVVLNLVLLVCFLRHKGNKWEEMFCFFWDKNCSSISVVLAGCGRFGSLLGKRSHWSPESAIMAGQLRFSEQLFAKDGFTLSPNANLSRHCVFSWTRKRTCRQVFVHAQFVAKRWDFADVSWLKSCEVARNADNLGVEDFQHMNPQKLAWGSWNCRMWAITAGALNLKHFELAWR